MLSQRPNESSKNPLLLQATRNLIARLGKDEAADPVLLARRAGLNPDPWQADVLRSPARQTILNVTRQGGKSTVSSVKALHRALYRNRSLVLLIAPSLRQSKELFRKVHEVYNSLASPVRMRQETTLELEFSNLSRIVTLPGNEATIRGFSGVSLLIVDEASRVPDLLYQAVRPMLAVSGGDILLLSTPFGKRGFFFHEWTEGGPDWHRVEVTADKCPRIPPAWLEEERRALPRWIFSQEYMCEFSDTIDQVFSFEDIRRAMDNDIAPLFEVA